MYIMLYILKITLKN